jgi:hypothetical protein
MTVINLDTSENISGITITNPGTGYIAAPILTLTGGTMNTVTTLYLHLVLGS